MARCAEGSGGMEPGINHRFSFLGGGSRRRILPLGNIYEVVFQLWTPQTFCSYRVPGLLCTKILTSNVVIKKKKSLLPWKAVLKLAAAHQPASIPTAPHPTNYPADAPCNEGDGNLSEEAEEQAGCKQ